MCGSHYGADGFAGIGAQQFGVVGLAGITLSDLTLPPESSNLVGVHGPGHFGCEFHDLGLSCQWVQHQYMSDKADSQHEMTLIRIRNELRQPQHGTDTVTPQNLSTQATTAGDSKRTNQAGSHAGTAPGRLDTEEDSGLPQCQHTTGQRIAQEGRG
jgi:hypothetical protein